MSTDVLLGAPRPAATLILVRASVDGPEILLLKRSASARFMPNAYVFAGGAVDAADTAAAAYALSPNLNDGLASDTLGLPAHGLGFYVAAVRESFEECGLLLAHDDSGAWVDLAAWPQAQLQRARADLGSGSTSLADLCRRHGWSLALDRLYYFAHWVTPVGMQRRFDTRFFIAQAPHGQPASLAGSEMTELLWRTPRAALRDHAEGRILLMTATRASLNELTEFADADSLLKFARTPRKILAVLPVLGRDVKCPLN